MTITDKQIEAAQDAYRKHVAEHGVEGSAEAMRAALEAADAAAWEPIETAPKDGTEIMVFRPDAGVFTAWWHYANDEGDCSWFSIEGEDLTQDMPTLWRPLPTPPKGE